MPYRIQGQDVSLGAEPTLINDKHYIPLRDVITSLGGTVDYDNMSKSAYAKIGPWQARITDGSNDVMVTGDDGTNTPVNLTAAPTMQDGEMYVPWDFLRDAYGYQVSLDNGTLEITNPNQPA